MRILLVQESNWLTRGPHQQHHIMEKLNLRGHDIHVLDFDIAWNQQKNGLYSRRQVFGQVNRIYEGGYVTLTRPGIINLPFWTTCPWCLTIKENYVTSLRSSSRKWL